MLWDCTKQTLYSAVLFLQALDRCNLRHCVCLWQLLSSLKSENMLRLKRVRVAFAAFIGWLNAKQELNRKNRWKAWALASCLMLLCTIKLLHCTKPVCLRNVFIPSFCLVFGSFQCILQTQTFTQNIHCNWTHIKYLTPCFNQKEPFSGYPDEYKEPLTEEDKIELKGFVSRANVDQWLLEMHEFLLLSLGRLRATDDYNPSWR